MVSMENAHSMVGSPVKKNKNPVKAAKKNSHKKTTKLPMSPRVLWAMMKKMKKMQISLSMRGSNTN